MLNTNKSVANTLQGYTEFKKDSPNKLQTCKGHGSPQSLTSRNFLENYQLTYHTKSEIEKSTTTPPFCKQSSEPVENENPDSYIEEAKLNVSLNKKMSTGNDHFQRQATIRMKYNSPQFNTISKLSTNDYRKESQLSLSLEDNANEGLSICSPPQISQKESNNSLKHFNSIQEKEAQNYSPKINEESEFQLVEEDDEFLQIKLNCKEYFIDHEKYMNKKGQFNSRDFINKILADEKIRDQYQDKMENQLNSSEFVNSINNTKKNLFRKDDNIHFKKCLILEVKDLLLCLRTSYIEDYHLFYRATLPGIEIPIPIYVKFRPFVFEFLDDMSQKYELIAYFYENPLYISQALDFLESKKKYFSARLGKEYFFKPNSEFGLKHLDYLTKNRSINDMIVVDTKIGSYSLFLFSGIPIKSFFGKENDSELVQLASLLDDLLNSVAPIPEVLGKLFKSFFY